PATTASTSTRWSGSPSRTRTSPSIATPTSSSVRRRARTCPRCCSTARSRPASSATSCPTRNSRISFPTPTRSLRSGRRATTAFRSITWWWSGRSCRAHGPTWSRTSSVSCTKANAPPACRMGASSIPIVSASRPAGRYWRSSSTSATSRSSSRAACRSTSCSTTPRAALERDDSLELLHHLPDLLGHCLRQAQGLAYDLVDLFAGGAVDHQVAFLAGGQESRVAEHSRKRGSQRREPLGRHARRGENRAADLAGAGGCVQHLAAFVGLRKLGERRHLREKAMPLQRGLVKDDRFAAAHPAGMAHQHAGQPVGSDDIDLAPFHREQDIGGAAISAYELELRSGIG